MELFSNVCDVCGNLPIPFECGNEDFSMNETAYYHTVPKRSEDPSTLMSNGDLMFKVCVSPEHPVLTEEMHICSNCFLKLYGDRVNKYDESDPMLEG